MGEPEQVELDRAGIERLSDRLTVDMEGGPSRLVKSYPCQLTIPSGVPYDFYPLGSHPTDGHARRALDFRSGDRRVTKFRLDAEGEAPRQRRLSVSITECVSEADAREALLDDLRALPLPSMILDPSLGAVALEHPPGSPPGIVCLIHNLVLAISQFGTKIDTEWDHPRRWCEEFVADLRIEVASMIGGIEFLTDESATSPTRVAYRVPEKGAGEALWFRFEANGGRLVSWPWDDAFHLYREDSTTTVLGLGVHARDPQVDGRIEL